MGKNWLRSATYVLFIIVLIIVLTISGFLYIPRNAFSDTAGIDNPTADAMLRSEIAVISQQKQALTATQGKIDWNLLQTVQQINEQHSVQPAGEILSFENLSTPMFNINKEGAIEVKLTVSDNLSDERINRLKALGMDITITLPKYGIVEGSLSYDAIETVAGLDFVRHVGTPGYAVIRTGSVTSEGDSVLKADLARSTCGVNGSGSKIGVMSDGVDHLANSVATGDLPSDVQVLKNDSGDEGTAMLEIIHDLAPGADLAFYTGINSSSDMVAGIGALESAGCNIIVDDIGWYGQPKFEDGPIALRARQFVNDGGIYVTAAGNSREDHYNHQYVRAAGPGGDYTYAHDYGSGDIGNSFTIPNGYEIYVILQWNNKFGSSSDDLDLFLVKSSDGTILTGSGNPQDGDDDPFEWFSWYNDTGSSVTTHISIMEYSLVSAPSSLVLDYYVLFSSYSLPLQYSTPNDSLFGHPAVEEVLSTATVDAAAPGTLEYYSSCGPATIYFPSYEERQVPNITGVDGVQTETGVLGHFYNPFYGTSAAAPHIAAIAALVWEANPTLNSSQVRSAITSTAADLSTAGFDYESGWGRADASAAVNSVGFVLNVTASVGGTVTSPGIGVYGPYKYGKVVNLTAASTECYRFINWTGNTSAIANVSSPSTTIKINSSYSITANFATDPFSGGNGTPGNPYLIQNACQLQNMNSNLGAYYALVNDINVSSTSFWNGGSGFLPVGNNVSQFNGSFDGRRYTIIGLYINRSSTDYVGLFGYVGTVGTINNVSLLNVSITGKRFTGGLIGQNDGTVNNSFSNGNVAGSIIIGGLVGSNNGGTVSKSYSTGNTVGSLTTGGLIGSNNGGTVSNSYSTANVNGGMNTGGLVGRNIDGTISKSYSTGNIDGSLANGGLVGSNSGGTVSNSFWDIQTSGQSSSAGGTGKTTAEMKALSTFTNVGWDFICETTNGISDVWGIDLGGTDNNGYPFLSWQEFTNSIFTLTTNSSEHGNVSIPGEGSLGPYNCSDVIHIVAASDPGYQFLGWSGNTSAIADPGSPSTAITMNNSYNITANFGLEPTRFYGDSNRDGVLGLADYSAVQLMRFGKLPFNPSGDSNGDGLLGLADYSTVQLMRFGKLPTSVQYEVPYDFLSGAGVNRWASINTISTNPPANNSDNETGWTGATAIDYNNISITDGNVCAITGTTGKYAAIQCKFTLAEIPASITSIGITLNGSAENNGDILQLWAWNFTTSTWTQIDSNFSMTTGIASYSSWTAWGKVFSNYIDVNGHMFILTSLNTSGDGFNIDNMRLLVVHP